MTLGVAVPFQWSLLVIVSAGVMPLLCSRSYGPERLINPPRPPVIFRGWINGDYIELDGSWPLEPNRCELWGDTIRVFLYSSDYSPSSIPAGCHVRLDIHPLPRDLADTAPPTLLGTTWTMLHVVRHHETMTESYLITPADSIYHDRYVRARIGALDRSPGGRLLLEGFCAQSPPIFGTAARQPLRIENAVIDGRVQ